MVLKAASELRECHQISLLNEKLTPLPHGNYQKPISRGIEFN